MGASHPTAFGSEAQRLDWRCFCVRGRGTGIRVLHAMPGLPLTSNWLESLELLKSLELLELLELLEMLE